MKLESELRPGTDREMKGFLRGLMIIADTDKWTKERRKGREKRFSVSFLFVPQYSHTYPTPHTVIRKEVTAPECLKPLSGSHPSPHVLILRIRKDVVKSVIRWLLREREKGDLQKSKG